MQKIKFKGHSVEKLEWKQMDGWTDAKTVGNKSATIQTMQSRKWHS